MITKLLFFLFSPSYVVMKGIQIENRSIMWVGENPVATYDKSFGWILNFSNRDESYYIDSIHKNIWTKGQLNKWKALLGNKSTVVKREWFVWSRI